MTLLALLATLATQPAVAQDRTEVEVDVDMADSPTGFGLGVVLGEPTGLTMAVRPGPWSAVQAHASWSLIHDRARFNVDYLQSLTVVHPEQAALEFPLYLGIGGTVGVGGPDNEAPPWDEPTAWLGARVPFGISMLPHDVPIEVFGEIAPAVYVIPETTAGLEGAVGVRAYF